MKINNSEEAIDDLRMQLKREHIRNAELLSKVQDVKGDILVYIRVRPEETKPGEAKMIEILDQNSVGVKDIYTEQLKAFSFDRCFTEESSQLDVYNEFEHLAISVLSGYNVSLLAYGQTGSGKTYTMIGSEDNNNSNGNSKGLYYTLSNKIFDVIDTYPKGINVNIELSMYEIYNDELRDLLVERQKTKLTIISKPSGTYIQGLQKYKVESVSDIIEYLHRGEKVRATASTDINEHSSRSHCIMTLYITQTDSTGKCISGKLNIVDLAGSEKVKKSNAVGERLVEAQNINKSLSALGDVIAALDSKNNNKNKGSNVSFNNTHIPYRNSKLTYALKDSLSPHSKTIMIFTIRPNEGFVDETLSTLYFAQRVRSVNLGEAKKIVQYKNRDDEVIHLTNKYNSLIKEREKLLKYIDNVKDIEQDHLREKDLIIAQLNKKINNLILEQSVYDDDVSDKVKSATEQVEKYKMKNKELNTKLDEISRKYYELNIKYKNLQEMNSYSELSRRSTTLMQSASKLEEPEEDIPLQQTEQLKMKYSFSSTLPNSFTSSKLQLSIVDNEEETDNSNENDNEDDNEQLPPPPSQTKQKTKKPSQAFRKTWTNQSSYENSTQLKQNVKKSSKNAADTSKNEEKAPRRLKKKVHKLPPPKPLTATISSQNKPLSAAEIRKQYDSAIRSKLKKSIKPKKKNIKSSEKILFADMDEI